jgi:iron complex transport system substrate-binding protein
MRIASLVPSATEALFALGLGPQVVAVTHECDYPAEARSLPQLTRSLIPPRLTAAAEIDDEVKRLTAEGRALYELDVELLRELEIDLIVTQQVCRVCAVSYEDVVAIAAELPSRPKVLSLDPTTLDEALDDALRIAEAAGRPEKGQELADSLRRRLDAVRAAVADARRPRVIALEWLDPPYSAGHWLPEMIEIAGGEEALGLPPGRSIELSWQELYRVSADLAVIMPCGWPLGRGGDDAMDHMDELLKLDCEGLVVVDATASFSRPGPRLVDGTELLAHILHPDLCPDPRTIPWSTLHALDTWPGAG